MRTYRLILVGFGNVGQGFAQILREQGDELAAQGLQAVIVAVSDLLKGSVYRPAGGCGIDIRFYVGRFEADFALETRIIQCLLKLNPHYQHNLKAKGFWGS